ncbi:3-ketoacyl-CoA synthase 12-like [Canna indica]|uniref:3-ketoacyl-CoA synthase 12-like n=1 Tax=Canna indica TaxID=4628 RepID=A0AAQ3QE13_9LILI|nr:3-ketoacyl-CoA synthase 12-like [Canna indica]
MEAKTRFSPEDIGANNDAHNCAAQKEDNGGLVGFFLGKDLPKVAVRVFTENLQRLLPNVLPVRELVLFAARPGSEAEAAIAEGGACGGEDELQVRDRPLMPPHGGRSAVIEGAGKNLGWMYSFLR